jgi:type I restriction enzyme S subunit
MSDDEQMATGWTPTTLGELGEYLNGRAFKRGEWSKTGRPIIRIQDLTGSNQNPNYFQGEVEDRYVVRPGDLLISWSATLGAYIWNGPEAVLNQHIFKVQSKIDKRFHYHLVRDRIAELLNSAHGSGMVHITKGLFDSTPVLVPDEDEQYKVAQFIDKCDAKLNSANDHVASMKKAVASLRQAILAAACTGRLTEDWRQSHRDAVSIENALTECSSNRKRRATNEQPVDLDLPELPETYMVAALVETTTLLEYGTSKHCDAGPGVPILRMGNIQDGTLDLADLKYCNLDKEIERLILHDGDLLFNRTNSPELVGKSAVFHSDQTMSFASYLIRARFCEEVALPDFVCFWLNSAWGRAWAQLAKTDGVSQSNINGTKLGLMPLPLPPINEQRVIVERASHLLKFVDELLSRASDMSKSINFSSRAVLSKALRGEMSL